MQSNISNRMEEVLQTIPTLITEDINQILTQPFTIDELKSACFSLGALKVPGPDGYTAKFFQSHWEVVKQDILMAANSFLNSGCLLKEMNETTFVLVPKRRVSTSIKHFRPISLRNVVYKILSKALTNRLRPVLEHNISVNQGAFVPGRSIQDNIIIAQEGLHSLKRRYRGLTGNIAMKLDMYKAYDCVNWEFLMQVMAKWALVTAGVGGFINVFLL